MQDRRPRETHIGIFAAVIACLGLVWAIIIGLPDFREEYASPKSSAIANGTESVTNMNLPLASDAEADRFIGNWCSVDPNWTEYKFTVFKDNGLFFFKLNNSSLEKMSNIENRPVPLKFPFKQGDSFIFNYNSRNNEPSAIVASIVLEFSSGLWHYPPSSNTTDRIEAATISKSSQDINREKIWHVERC